MTTPPLTADPMVELVSHLQHAQVAAEAEVKACQSASDAAREDLVRTIEAGGKTDAAEKKVTQADQGLASATLRQQATAEAAKRASTRLERAGRKSELERQKAIHETAVSAYGLARERLAVAWAAFETGLSDVLGLQLTARWSCEAAKALGAGFENVISQDPVSHSELCRLRLRVKEILIETGRAVLDPPPPEITICGYSASRLNMHGT
jgi:hypothetical protein